MIGATVQVPCIGAGQVTAQQGEWYIIRFDYPRPMRAGRKAHQFRILSQPKKEQIMETPAVAKPWAEMSASEIKQALAAEGIRLIDERKKADEAKAAYDAAKEAWEKANAALIDAKKATAEKVTTMEDRLRQGAVELFKLTGEKGYEAFSIRETPTPDYDLRAMTDYLIDHAPVLAKTYLTVDAKKLDPYLKTIADPVSGAMPHWLHIGALPAIVRKQPTGVITSDKLKAIHMPGLPTPVIVTASDGAKLDAATGEVLVASPLATLKEAADNLLEKTGDGVKHWWIARTNTGSEYVVYLSAAEAQRAGNVVLTQKYASRETAEANLIPF